MLNVIVCRPPLLAQNVATGCSDAARSSAHTLSIIWTGTQNLDDRLDNSYLLPSSLQPSALGGYCGSGKTADAA